MEYLKQKPFAHTHTTYFGDNFDPSKTKSGNNEVINQETRNPCSYLPNKARAARRFESQANPSQVFEAKFINKSRIQNHKSLII